MEIKSEKPKRTLQQIVYEKRRIKHAQEVFDKKFKDAVSFIATAPLLSKHFSQIQAIINLRNKGDSSQAPVRKVVTRDVLAETPRNAITFFYVVAKHLHKHTKASPPSLPQFALRNKNLYQMLCESAEQLTKTINEMFPGITKLQNSAMMDLFVELAAQEMDRCNRPHSPRNFFELVHAFPVLLEWQFPDYYDNGLYLPQLLLQRNSLQDKYIDLDKK